MPTFIKAFMFTSNINQQRDLKPSGKMHSGNANEVRNKKWYIFTKTNIKVAENMKEKGVSYANH